MRADILPSVSFLLSRVNNPTEQDLRKLNRVFEYLSGTLDYGIKYTGGAPIDLQVWADASYMCHEDSRSRSGVVAKMCGGVITATSSKQNLVTKSSCEAELVSLCAGTTWALVLREFMHHQGYVMPLTRIYQDNKSVLALMKSGKPTSHHTKHIKMRWCFVVQHVDVDVSLVWCCSKEMIGDGLSKILIGEQFVVFRGNVVCINSEKL